MDEKRWLVEQFEANRARLRAVAYRMLGSRTEAEDAVQEAWLKFSRADARSVDNLSGWLTTVVARVCLDLLRARKSRREEPLDPADMESQGPRPIAGPEAGSDPEHEAMLADSVGLALLVVLKTLEPAERVAFVLHDMFAVPFEEIAPVVGRSPAAARQLASRARRRVQGASEVPAPDLAQQRRVVDAFLAASRGGDFEALLAVLDPDVVFRPDAAAVRMGGTGEIRGAAAVAATFKGRAQAARPALVDGEMGLAVVFGGRVRVVLRLTVANGRIAEIEAVADPERLGRFDLDVLDAG